MMELSNFMFLYPWVLLSLISLPLLWWLLKITPPPAQHIKFPAIMLLKRLVNRSQTAEKTPWWLMAYRTLLASLLIFAFAQPVSLNDQSIEGAGPLLLIIDNDWSMALPWEDTQKSLGEILKGASRKNQPIYLATTIATNRNKGQLISGPMTVESAREIIHAMVLLPLQSDLKGIAQQIKMKKWPQGMSAIWFSTGLDHPAQQSFFTQLNQFQHVYFNQAPQTNHPVSITLKKSSSTENNARLRVHLQRPNTSKNNGPDLKKHLPQRTYSILMQAKDGRTLGRQDISFAVGEGSTSSPISLPETMLSEITQLIVENQPHAAARFLLDSRWRNAQIGIVHPEGEEELPLLSETFYLDKATEGLGAISIAPLSVLLRLKMSVLLLPDSKQLSTGEISVLSEWVKNGGVLVRFAGPNLAQHHLNSTSLLPVSIREGGRALNGLMQWGAPVHLKSFAVNTPLEGLKIPKDIIVKQQILAESGQESMAKSWARLADGTSLISGRKEGDGWLVLAHTSANANWSNLALSGVFPALIQRISTLAFSTGGGSVKNKNQALPPLKIMDVYGQLRIPKATVRSLNLTEDGSQISAKNPPGLYGDSDYHQALNLSETLGRLHIENSLPEGVKSINNTENNSHAFKPTLLITALLMFFIDGIMSLFMRGQLSLRLHKLTIYFLLLLPLFSLLKGENVHAQGSQIVTKVPSLASPINMSNMSGTGLAYVKTGHPKIDKISEEGLSGLALILNQRTAIEASSPTAIELGKDELSFYSLLYWPITKAQNRLSQTAIDHVNTYLSFGGSILFDLRNKRPDNDREGGAQKDLERLTYGLNIPELILITDAHVLTKSFYLLQDFPGRWRGSNFWVEPAHQGTADGVSRILIGHNDWAAAWAMDEYGRPRYPVTPGGEGQREMAYRFGVNLMMYMLTGNYKKDQVHIPAILERLGQ